MNPKRKGNSFERELCKILTFYYNPNLKELVFVRDSSSGRYLGKAKNCIGDVFCLLDNFPSSIIIEAKYYSNFVLNLKNVNLIYKFIEQYSKDFEDFSLYIFIKTRKGLFFVTNKIFDVYPYFQVDEKFRIYDFDKVKSKYTFEQFFGMEENE